MSEQADRIHQAVAQEYDASKLSSYYKGWADKYDDDVTSNQYVAPAATVQLLAKHVQAPAECHVLDVGCGTGLAAKHLKEAGFEVIDGFDLSQEMVNNAQELGLYRDLWGSIDMTKQFGLSVARYDAAVAVGVFTTGHVKPESLENVLEYMNRGGVVVLTAREEYCEEHRLDEYLGQLASNGKIELIEVERNQLYHDLSKAHYYALHVL